MKVATYDDVLAIERTPLAERNIPSTPYAMLRAGAAIAPDAPALTFFAQASRFTEATVWSHRELVHRTTQAGNLFRRLGVERGDAVAFILPISPKRISPSGAAKRRGSPSRSVLSSKASSSPASSRPSSRSFS